MVDLFEGFNTESLFGLDICFVIDSTGSMISYITGAKNSIKEIMNQSSIRFKKYKADESMLKFGIVAYRDHPPQEHSWVTREKDFTDFENSTKFLEELNASGGGDPPEAVLDGLYDAVFKLNWRDTSEKILFLLLDNPGHGIRWGTIYDCPCGYHEKDILKEMKNKQINLVVLRPKEENHKLDRMIDEFSKYVELETYALTKYSYHNYYLNDTEDSKKTATEMESRILDNLRNKRINKFNCKTEKSKNSSESPKRRERERNVLDSDKRKDRSRSNSLSKSDVEMDSKNINGAKNLKDSPKHDFKTKNSMIITDENCLERGIKDIITNTVILKLDKQLHNELLRNKMNEDSVIELNPTNSTWIPEKINKNNNP